MTGMRWLVSLVTVQHRARGASPTSSVLTQTAPKWLMRDCCHPAAHFLLPPPVDSENHLDEIKTAALLGRPADQWQGGRRSWQRRRERGGLLRSGKEGFLCNGVENTEEKRDRLMPFVIFGPLTPPPSPSPPPCLPLVPCRAFILFYCIYLFKPDCFTLRVRGRVTKSSLITVFMDKFNALERIFCSLSVILF